MSKANKMECGSQTCDCCGGSLPAKDIWEANRDVADDCDGSVDSNGRCRAFSRDELWEVAAEYELVETASGWAVEREDGAWAEFLSRGEVNEVLAALKTGETTEADYEWQERE